MLGQAIDVFIKPGEFYFGDQEIRIKTILGSCVALTLWNPRLHIGGMCHYMLPTSNQAKQDIVLDGRYADNAMKLFMNEIEKTNMNPADFEVKMFGGGLQFERASGRPVIDVSERNIEKGRQLLNEYGFTLKSQHLGGTGYRTVVFDIKSGDVWVRYVENSTGV